MDAKNIQTIISKFVRGAILFAFLHLYTQDHTHKNIDQKNIKPINAFLSERRKDEYTVS